MLKKMVATFTTIVAALAVVGVAWAGGDDTTSTSAASETSTSIGESATTTEVTSPGSSTPIDDEASEDSITVVDPQSTTSTSVASSTSTSVEDSQTTTSTSIPSTTSTSLDDDGERVSAPEGVSTHRIPGVGSVTISVSGGRLALVDVSVAWTIQKQRVESDRIELELVSGDADAKFEARINDGRVEIRVDVDSD